MSPLDIDSNRWAGVGLTKTNTVVPETNDYHYSVISIILISICMYLYVYIFMIRPFHLPRETQLD